MRSGNADKAYNISLVQFHSAIPTGTFNLIRTVDANASLYELRAVPFDASADQVQQAIVSLDPQFTVSLHISQQFTRFVDSKYVFLA